MTAGLGNVTSEAGRAPAVDGGVAVLVLVLVLVLVVIVAVVVPPERVFLQI